MPTGDLKHRDCEGEYLSSEYIGAGPVISCHTYHYVIHKNANLKALFTQSVNTSATPSGSHSAPSLNSQWGSKCASFPLTF